MKKQQRLWYDVHKRRAADSPHKTLVLDTIHWKMKEEAVVLCVNITYRRALSQLWRELLFKRNHSLLGSSLLFVGTVSAINNCIVTPVSQHRNLSIALRLRRCGYDIQSWKILFMDPQWRRKVLGLQAQQCFKIVNFQITAKKKSISQLQFSKEKMWIPSPALNMSYSSDHVIDPEHRAAAGWLTELHIRARNSRSQYRI